MRKLFLLALISIVGFGDAAAAASRKTDVDPIEGKPKLILAVVFDQFRGDYITRFDSRFLPAQAKNGTVGGFRYLVSEGAYYPFAEYQILQSMTGPGHATILTGSYPYLAGIPINYWYDFATAQPEYCVEDRSAPTVGATPRSPHAGTSPRNLLATTVGDELKNAGYPSRVVSVSIKDRAAILMGGHRADIAVWFDQESGHWVSSRYYLPDGQLPPWVQKLNTEVDAKKGTPVVWEATGEGSGLSSTGPFKHEAKFPSHDALATPTGLDITVTAAERALDAYQLGRGKSTDLLAVSFSSHDYAGHAYGPNSREMEEMTVADDRALSHLLNAVAKRVPGGLKNVTVVLTGDHGIPPDPDYLKDTRIVTGRIDADAQIKEIDDRLNDKFGKAPHGHWVALNSDLNYFFDRDAVQEKHVDLAALENEARAAIIHDPGVAFVMTSTESATRHYPPGMIGKQVERTYYPGRVGNVTVLPKPYFIKKEDPADHLTGYAFDRSVPLLLSGYGIRHGYHAEKAYVVDIAPTLTFLAHVVTPSLSEGRVLSEALDVGAPQAK